MRQILFKRPCPRCHNKTQYVSYQYFSQVEKEDPNGCKICKVVSDSSLKAFVEEKKYVRYCPKCGNPTVHKRRETFRAAVRLNRPCKSCTSKHAHEQKLAEMRIKWLPIIGVWPVKNYNTFVLIRSHWESLSSDEKKEFLSKTSKQKRHFWSHIRRFNRNAGVRRCRATFAKKYSGENHWMKRPEVLRKMRRTFRKYRGDNHWFRRDKVST